MADAVQLDDMLLKPDAAKWLTMSEKDLERKSKGRKAVIPVFRVGEKSPRYNPRTIIAKLANDAGVPAHVIAASFGMELRKAAS